jgi:murein DD-endopeptidase MepM/ murein hydrolase activator NlpD
MGKNWMGWMVLVLVSCTQSQGVNPPTETQMMPALTPSPTNPIEPTPSPQSTEAAILAPTPENTAMPTPDFRICSPLAEHSLADLVAIISDPYNPPPIGQDGRHHGVDFAYYQSNDRASIAGEEIQALLAGRIAAVTRDQLPYGNMVIVEVPAAELSQNLPAILKVAPDESLYILVAHMKLSANFNLGDEVRCGQALGIVGNTGYNIPVPHLHLETRIGPAGAIFENMVYYDTRATPADMEAYELWRMSGTFRHFDPLIIIKSDRHQTGNE